MRTSARSSALGVFLLASAVLAAGMSCAEPQTALAHPAGPNVPYTVNVYDEWGNALRTFHKDGQTFVLGSYGQRYKIHVRNQTGQRVEAVVSVDGRDAVSGNVGDYTSERGYVIDAWGTLDVEGFRTSMEQVAAFRFTNPGDSYSSRMGTPENVGVIGVAFFPERHRPRPPRVVVAPRPQPVPYRRYDYDYDGASGSTQGESRGRMNKGAGAADESAHASAAPAPAKREAGGYGYDDSARDKSASRGAAEAEPAAAADSVSNLGTQYGEATTNHVDEVSFRRADASRPAQIIALRYDDESGLLARGIELYEPPVVSRREPSPFPYNRFAPPPP